MNRVDIAARAREITELTDDDISDVVLYLYARDGYERIINLERRWPFFEASTTLTTTAADAEYSLTTDLDDLAEIKSIRRTSNGVRLTMIGVEDGEDTFSPETTGTPNCWSLWAGSVRLWPTPNAAIGYTVRGYRKPSAWWETDGAEIDADERLHTPVLYYVLARLYQFQEDPEMSNFYASTFVEATRSARDEIMRVSSASPLVLNRGVVLRSPSTVQFLVN